MPDKLASKARSAHRVQILPHTSELTLASHGPKAHFDQEDIMDLTLCGQSAFYYHRIPPQLALAIWIADVAASEVMQL